MQTTLLGLAIAFILALLAALIGPFFIDWNQFRPQFEAEAAKVIGAPVRVSGGLDARLLPTPTLRLRSVVVGGANDLGKVHADKLDVEFSLGDLMRGQWRANELTINGMALDLGLDQDGRIDWPVSSGMLDLSSLSVDRLKLTGRLALHDAASRATVELNNIVFSGDVRSLAGSLRGGGSFVLEGTRYPFRITSGQSAGGNGTRVHLSIDPGERPLSVDFDGTVNFPARAPVFEGVVTIATPLPKAKGGESPPTPWRIASKVKADHATAQLDQIEASYGGDERALKFTGAGDIRFGASPLLHATLSARQLDADKLLSNDDATDKIPIEPARQLTALRAAATSLPYPPIPTNIEVSTEQIMLGGRPLQNLSASLHGDASSWAIDRLEFRAPGATQVSFNSVALHAPSETGTALAGFSGAIEVESSDPDMLLTWLQGRTDPAYHSQKPLRLRGNLSVINHRVAIEKLKAEIDGGALEGRVALATSPGGSQFEAALKAQRLDLDAAGSVVQAVAGPRTDWPEQGSISLEIDRAVSAGQELHPLVVNFQYSPRILALEKLKFGYAGGVSVEGTGSLDRSDATGIFALRADAASLSQVTGIAASFAPALAERLNPIATQPGPARLKLALDLGKNSERADRANARALLDLNAPQLQGSVTITAKLALSAIRTFDLDQISRSEVTIDSKLSAGRGNALLALLGLDRAIAAGEGTLQFEGSASGARGAPLRLNTKMWGAGIDAEAQGTFGAWSEPRAQAPAGNVNLRIRSINLAPLFGLKPSDSLAQNVRLFGHASLAGNKLSFDDLDSVVAGSRLRGHLAISLDEQREIDGDVGLDVLDLAPSLALAIGATGHEATEPLGNGMLKGWRGRVAFQALSGRMPGGSELRPIGGILKSDGQSLSFEAVKGKLGGGDVTANIDARRDANGVALNAHLELAGVEGAALNYRGLKMPAGSTSVQTTLVSQGRSLSSLVAALSGGGAVALESANIAGLDPRAFEAAIRASDAGQVTDDARLRQLVGTVLSAGTLQVTSAQIPFTIRDGRLRVDATTLDGAGARAIVSGGYDISADQADIRASLSSTAFGSASSRPEIQLFAAGPPDALARTIDVSPLSSWLAVRVIDRETRRLDALERGEPPPVEPALPPSTAALPLPAAPSLGPIDQPLLGRGRLPPKAKQRPPATPPASTAPPVNQQAPPLPPAVEVRPAPGSPPGAAPLPAPVKPKPRPPLVLAPPVANP